MTMDYKDVLFGVGLVSLYGVLFLGYAAAGSLLAGHRIASTQDLLRPLGKAPQGPGGSSLTALYYLAFLVLTVVSGRQLLSMRGSFRSWIERLGKTPELTSASSRALIIASSPSPASSSTNLSPKASRKRVRRSRSRTAPPEPKVKNPNVLRSSMVSPSCDILPPLARMSVRDDIPEKLEKLIKKCSSLDVSADGKYDPAKRTKDD